MKCNNCGGTQHQSFSEARCYFSNQPLSVVKCSDCDLVFLYPRPDKNLGLAYFENAYANAEGFENHGYYRDHEQILKRNKVRFDTINKLDVPNKKVLDFGAGQGHFVKMSEDNGWTANGLELSSAAIQAAKNNFGLELLDSIHKLKTSDFGVITLWDVIEHLDDPKKTISELIRFLHPKGFLVIETSNIDSSDYLVNKEKWSYWHIDHLYYYSRKSIHYLLACLHFRPINLSPTAGAQKSVLNKFISKYKKLKNPTDLIFELKKRWIQYKFKNIESKSLMTIVFKRNSTF